MNNVDAISKNVYLNMEVNRLKANIKNGYITKEKAWDFITDYVEREWTNGWNREKMKENIFKFHPNANQEVINFILNFNWHNGESSIMQETIRRQFRAGYCYYFAEILKLAFQRGTVCWCAPYSHICWMDEDGIPYDIEGVCESDCEYYIPISYIEDGILDFMHIPDKEFNATREYINQAIEKCKQDILSEKQ